jgi:hypothetical protein
MCQGLYKLTAQARSHGGSICVVVFLSVPIRRYGPDLPGPSGLCTSSSKPELPVGSNTRAPAPARAYGCSLAKLGNLTTAEPVIWWMSDWTRAGSFRIRPASGRKRDRLLLNERADARTSSRIQNKGVNQPSPDHRFVIALHSPHGVFETGLPICPPEKRAAKLA